MMQMQKPLVPAKVEKTTDNILNDYNRSKIKNQLENTTKKTTSSIYDFANDQKFVDHLVMTMHSLISVIKQNPNVELQCFGHFEVLFGFLSTSATENVRILQLIPRTFINYLISEPNDQMLGFRSNFAAVQK